MNDDRLAPIPQFSTSVPSIALTSDGQLVQSVAIEVMAKLATQDGTSAKEDLQRYAVYAFEIAEILLAESLKRYGDTSVDLIKF